MSGLWLRTPKTMCRGRRDSRRRVIFLATDETEKTATCCGTLYGQYLDRRCAASQLLSPMKTATVIP